MLATATVLAVLAAPTGAYADIVSNTVVAGGSPSVAAGDTTTIGYTIRNQNERAGDPQGNCNPADSTPATVKVNVPAGVTVAPASRTFTSCDTTQFFDFTSATPGTYSISVSVTDSGTGTYTTSGAAFSLTVTKPVVVNTAPSVAVKGVANGASYELGNVPAATCSVTDKEDGSSSFDAGLGPVTGARAADGLGTQTASCSYDDAGGLNAKASATYSIVDTSKPLVSATAPAPTEATGPLTPVTFAASAYDAVDGPRPVTCTAGGAAYASGDGFPVGTTTLTCSATDKAGNTGAGDPIAVVVRDTSAPEVFTAANKVVGNNAPQVTYDAATATDLVDGTVAATCTPASGSTFALGTTTVTCTATDKAGNKGVGTFTVEVQDTTKPVVSVPADRTAEATGAAGAAVRWDAATAVDDVDGAVAVSCSSAPGSVFPIGTTTVTCSAADKAGNLGDSSFTVTVRDTTAPAVRVPEGVVEEATSAAGAAASFTTSAHDAVDGAVTTTCTPASGSTFALGTTTVICSATDKAGNSGSDSFGVTVRDTRAPEVKVPADVVAEATGADGAEVAYGDVAANDVVDGPMNPSCSKASDTTFPLGTTTVTCTATDAANNTGTGSFTVKVVDTTAPEVTTSANLSVGNDSPTGARVTYTDAGAKDLVDGKVSATCDPASGSAFPLGSTTVTCTATDRAGNTGRASFTVEVQDRTKPVVTVPSAIVKEATGPSGATVAYMGVTASDDVDGPLTASCDKASGTVFPVGTTKVTCSAKDGAGNVGDNSFDVTVEDTTAPNVTVSSARSAVATSVNGAVVSYAAATATDLVDGNVAAACDKPSGTVFPLGTTTVTCTAKDKAGNTGTERFTVTVTAAWSGVLQPVNTDGSSVFKLGSTVPVKFQLTGASAGITTLPARLYLQRLGSAATGTSIEAVSTSNATTGNLFRYDATSGQYVFNLSTKTLSSGSYQLRIDMGDGVTRTVNVSLR
ncbi:HYR domain-containing protein [Nocardioides xinjiangensis]|uniref:HYR domain-containing protein n=1 Tax=Nocardioides xinjiangensis TaxID=2817376 RepID=UPI001B305619|nr:MULTISPECIES: HYR domain-containing protein [unclassified Nocardioides]